MKGYKGFKFTKVKGKRQLNCLNTVFSTDKPSIIKKSPICCVQGFHFCKTLRQVLQYYGLSEHHFFGEVFADGKLHTDDNKKFATNKLRITRVLSMTEVMTILKGKRHKKELSSHRQWLKFGLTDFFFDTPELYHQYLTKIHREQKLLYTGYVWSVRFQHRSKYSFGPIQAWKQFAVITKIEPLTKKNNPLNKKK
jgi:hypothetical protein